MPLMVVTRAQALKKAVHPINDEEGSTRSSPNSQKARIQRRMAKNTIR